MALLREQPAPAPIWLLALLTLTGTLAMYMFVPALPSVAIDLASTPATLQLTISGYILGLAGGQLIYGPLADRFGRKPILMVGVAVYVAAGIGCALATNATTLIAARVLQALGGCSGMVIGRAIVRDGSIGADATRRMALVNIFVTAGPGLAPMAGSFLIATTGWRSIFAATCALGVTNLLLTHWRLPETAPPRAQTNARFVMQNYRQLIVSPAFLSYAVGGSLATTSWYAFVSAAPFIFVNQLHRPAHDVGFYLGAIVVFMWVGSVAASRTARSLNANRMSLIANTVSMVGATILLVAVLTGFLGITAIVCSMCLFALGVGMAAAPVLMQAISVNQHVVGSASGLYGFMQMLIGALAATLAGIGSNPALATAVILLTACLISQVLLRLPSRLSS
jgi:DHA1 family bicyclomycin/chloramphenicol resistance-like MFS transporter